MLAQSITFNAICVKMCSNELIKDGHPRGCSNNQLDSFSDITLVIILIDFLVVLHAFLVVQHRILLPFSVRRAPGYSK